MLKKITWRIVLSGESFVKISKENLGDPLQEAEERLSNIIDQKGIPGWNDIDIEITSVD